MFDWKFKFRNIKKYEKTSKKKKIQKVFFNIINVQKHKHFF